MPLCPSPKKGMPIHPRLKRLIITHKFLEPPVERIAKAEIICCLFNTTWLVTMARKSVPKDVGNDKGFKQGMNGPTLFGAWAQGYVFSDKMFIFRLQ